MAVTRNNFVRQLMPGLNALFGQELMRFNWRVAKQILHNQGQDDFVLYVTWTNSFQNVTGLGKPVIEKDALNVWPQLSAIDYDPDNAEGSVTWRTIEMIIHTRSNLLLKEESHA